MAGFLTRTPALDYHIAIRLNERAKQLSDGIKRVSEQDGEKYKDLDGPPMRKLADMFTNHEDTDYIYEWLCLQDTAFRDRVPVMVFNILKDNRHEQETPR
jgi:hypothetical protein